MHFIKVYIYTYFCRLYLQSYSYYPGLVTISKTGHFHTQLSLHLNRVIQRSITADATTTHLSVSRSTCTLHVNKNPRYLNSFVWGSNSFLPWRWHSTLFRLRILASDLEQLFLIPAVLHSAAKCPIASWRSPTDDAKPQDLVVPPLLGVGSLCGVVLFPVPVPLAKSFFFYNNSFHGIIFYTLLNHNTNFVFSEITSSMCSSPLPPMLILKTS